MFKKLFLSFLIALQNIKARIFHTLLSILGIVIGVAALVAILSLIDGMEKHARDQIANTTSIKSILITSNRTKNINNVRLKKENIEVLDYERFIALKSSLTQPYLHTSISSKIPRALSYGKDTLAAVLRANNILGDNDLELLHGRGLSLEDLTNKRNVIVINDKLAEDILGEKDYGILLGKTIDTKEWELEIVGITKTSKSKTSMALIPISIMPKELLKQHPPQVVIEAENVEVIAPLEKEIKSWLAKNFKNAKEDFIVFKRTQRVEQVAKGFLLFKLIMGLIVGISVVVGGIGVMNVLLISVTERTREIGICKAVGAKRKDILFQYLAESVSISALGSSMGLILGILGTLLIVPIVKMIVEIPFQAAYTWSTLLLVGIIAILVGIVFGTYPALQAAKLDPVDAIRKE